MQSELEKTYRQGLEQLEKGEWQQAIDSFLAVLRLDVDYKAAVAMLKEAQKEEKLENLYKKGETYLQQEAWRSAIETFKEVQGINAGYRDIKKKLREAEEKERLRNLYEQGQEHLANEEWQKAIDSFKKVQRQDPNYPDVVEKLRKAEEQKRLQDLYRRGVEYFRQGMWSNAIEKFNELQKTDHNYPDVAIKLEEAKAQKQMQQKLSDLYSKAKGYEEAGDWQEAINAYVDILRIDPEYGDVTERLSWINRRRKSSLASKSQKAHPMVLVWWNSLSPDGKAAVILGIGAIIVAIICGIFSTPFASRWWSSVGSSDTPTVVSAEVLTPTNTPSSTPTITITPTSTPSPTNTPTDTAMPTDTPTSTPHPGLALVSPPDKGALFPEEQNVKLVWKWEQDLVENEFFEVRIRLKGEQEFDRMDLTKMSYQFVPASNLTQGRTYEWQVAVVSLASEEKAASQIWSFEVR